MKHQNCIIYSEYICVYLDTPVYSVSSIAHTYITVDTNEYSKLCVASGGIHAVSS